MCLFGKKHVYSLDGGFLIVIHVKSVKKHHPQKQTQVNRSTFWILIVSKPSRIHWATRFKDTNWTVEKFSEGPKQVLKVLPAKTLLHFPISSHPSGRHVATVESAKTLRGGPKAIEYVEDRKAPQLFAKKNMLGPKIKRVTIHKI